MEYTTTTLEAMAAEQRDYIRRITHEGHTAQTAQTHLEHIEGELEKYRPYDVTPTGIQLSGYVVSFDQAEHYRLYGASVIVEVSTGGSVEGIVMDRALRLEIIAALQAAGIPEYEYNSIHGRMLPKLAPGEWRY